MTWEERNETIKQNEEKFRNIFKDCKDGFAILQLPIEKTYKFMGLKDAMKYQGPSREDYEVIYAKNMRYAMWKEYIPVANMLWAEFNMGNYPEDYFGTSLSVSDIVLIKISGVVRALYINNFGFDELIDFEI